MRRLIALGIVAFGLVAVALKDKAASTSPQQLEEQVLKLLSSGQQAEAEELLSSAVDTVPEIKSVLAHLRKREESQAEQIVLKQLDFYRKWQRIFFLVAACDRSRFDVQGTLPVFTLTRKIDETSAVGQAADLVYRLDGVFLVRLLPDETLVKFRKLADANPDDVVIRWMAAVQCRTHNRNEEGVEHYKKVLEKWKPGPVLVHQTYANLLHELQRYEDALVERRIAVKLARASWTYDGLANTLDCLNRHEEADKARAEVIQLEPDRSDYWCKWAVTCLHMNKFDEAIAKASRALELDPNNRFAQQTLKAARTAQATGLDKLGDRAVVERFEKGGAHMQKREWTKAIGEFTEAIRLNPKASELFSFRGEAHRMNGELDKAITDFTEAVRLDPKNTKAWGHRGLCYWAKKDWDGMIADSTEAFRADPKSAIALQNRAVGYAKKGECDKAIADCTQALQIDPKFSSAHETRGYAYLKKGDADQAIAECTKAIELDATNGTAYWTRSKAYKHKNQLDKAEADRTKAQLLGAKMDD